MLGPARCSLGVLGLLHDVAERPLRRASATYLWGCRARRRCCFDASSRGAGWLMQHLLRDHGRISGTPTCVNAQDACHVRFAPPENLRPAMRNLRCHAAIAADRAAVDKAPGSCAEQSSLTQRKVRWHGTRTQWHLNGRYATEVKSGITFWPAQPIRRTAHG